MSPAVNTAQVSTNEKAPADTGAYIAEGKIRQADTRRSMYWGACADTAMSRLHCYAPGFGIIPARKDDLGVYRAVIKEPPAAASMTALEFGRASEVRIRYDKALQNGFKPLPCTSNSP